MTKYIDTHVHLWSVEYLDHLKSLSSEGTDIAKNINTGITEDELNKRLR